MITIEEINGEMMTVVWHSEAFCQMAGITENREGSCIEVAFVYE